MGTKVRAKTNGKKVVRLKRRQRIRSRVAGTATRPRLSVFRSNRHFHVQLIDDELQSTILSVSTSEPELTVDAGRNVSTSKLVGELVAKRALARGIKTIVFDRSGYLYHGRIRALAEAARTSGLEF
jgi:large subunit ribosomal protein L18